MADIPVKIYAHNSLLPREQGTYSLNAELAISDEQVVGRLDKISSEVLRGNLSNFLTNFGQALAGIPFALAGYHVEEIELSLDIGAKGGISLITGSTDAGRNAPMKLTLRRSDRHRS